MHQAAPHKNARRQRGSMNKTYGDVPSEVETKSNMGLLMARLLKYLPLAAAAAASVVIVTLACISFAAPIDAGTRYYQGTSYYVFGTDGTYVYNNSDGEERGRGTYEVNGSELKLHATAERTLFIASKMNIKASEDSKNTLLHAVFISDYVWGAAIVAAATADFLLARNLIRNRSRTAVDQVNRRLTDIKLNIS